MSRNHWHARLLVLAHLAPAAVLLVSVELGLRTMTLPHLSRLLGVPLRTDPVMTPMRQVSVWRLGRRDAAAYRAAQLVAGVWSCGTGGMCLRLSLVAGCLLRRRRPTLHLGVAHTNGSAVAHAWITVDGLVVDSTAGRYALLTGTAS